MSASEWSQRRVYRAVGELPTKADPAVTAALRWAVLALTAITVVKFWLAVELPLFGDEAFYWWESTRLAAAYDDVPAATVWLIAASTTLFGDQTWAVRLPFLLLGLVSWWLLVRCASETAGPRAGLWAAWLGALLPLFAANGLLAVPDVPLNLAVLLCLYGVQRALREAPGARWALAGGLALGFLSHYRFAVPLFAAGLWLLASADGRALLRRPGLLLFALAGSALGLAPLLWQQWQSNAAGLNFQFADRHPWTLQAQHLLDPAAQALITSPPLYLALLVAGVYLLRSTQPAALRMFARLGLLLLLVYWVLGAFTDAERSRMHWPLPAYLALIVPLAALWSQAPRHWLQAWRRPALALATLWLLLATVYLVLVARAPELLVRREVYPSNFSGAEQAASELKQRLTRMPADTLIVADQFMLAAQLQFALPDREVFSLDHPLNIKHGRQTVLAVLQRDELSLRRQAGRPLLLVSELSANRLRQRPAHYRALCQRFGEVQMLADLWVDHGNQRYLFWQVPSVSGGSNRCSTPALAYVMEPGWNDRLSTRDRISGWAIRDWQGIRELRASADGTSLALSYGTPLPSLSDILPGLADPNHPRLGFEISLTGLSAGAHWIRIEANDPILGWVTIAEWPLRLEANK